MVAHKQDMLLQAWCVLGLGANPSYSDIRAAYCRLAMMIHPDRCSEANAKEHFQALQTAYEVALANQTRSSLTTQSTAGSSFQDFDWKKEVARVRAAYEKLNDQRKYNLRKPFGWKLHSTFSREMPQQTTSTQRFNNMYTAKPKGRRLRSAISATSGKEEEKKCRLEIIERRRRRHISVDHKLFLRIVTVESAHRQNLLHCENKAFRLLMLVFAEIRLWDALVTLEDMSWAEINKQWNNEMM